MLIPEKRSAPQYIVITCVYFKNSGKYYASGADRFEPSEFTGCIHPRDYAIRLRDAKRLPGLASGIWRGPILVNVGTYPELLMPDSSES